MPDRILSIAEITQLENAYIVGAPTLGIAAAELLRRWRFGLKDEETLLRLIFLRWYSLTEPPFLTGLNEFADEVEVENVLDEFGGEDRLSGEGRFVIAVLGHGAYAVGLGEEAAWHEKSRRYFLAALRDDPASRLFADWKYLIGEAKDTRNLKTKIEPEIHARFAGRGYMGEYLKHTLSGMLRPNRV